MPALLYKPHLVIRTASSCFGDLSDDAMIAAVGVVRVAEYAIRVGAAK